MISWLKSALPALGSAGLFLAAFLDSSFIPMPLVTDLIVMDLSSRHPARTAYFAALAALGSLAGCVWIYLLARKGGDAYYRKRLGQPRGRIYSWVKQHPLVSVLVPAIAPFPGTVQAFCAGARSATSTYRAVRGRYVYWARMSVLFRRISWSALRNRGQAIFV